jgi:Flp pilus assembly protein TadG
VLFRPGFQRRKAVTSIEAVIVFPVLFALVLSLLLGGMGVYRFQEVAALAREGSRWASVHGSLYEQQTGKPAATAADVYNNAIEPRAVTLDLSQLTYGVTWTPNNNPPDSTVTVTVSYVWNPLLIGPVTLSSTSTMGMSY